MRHWLPPPGHSLLSALAVALAVGSHHAHADWLVVLLVAASLGTAFLLGTLSERSKLWPWGTPR